jgi:hypothetical protein
MERMDEREREWRVALKAGEAALHELKYKHEAQQQRLRRQEVEISKV